MVKIGPRKYSSCGNRTREKCLSAQNIETFEPQFPVSASLALQPIECVPRQAHLRDNRELHIAVALGEAAMRQPADQISAKQFCAKRLLPKLDKTAREIYRFNSGNLIGI